MIEDKPESVELRVLFLAPTSKDSRMLASVLERAGVAHACCANLAQICRELEVGAGAVLLPEEIVAAEGDRLLNQWLANQPTWSDLPLLVMARPGADSAGVAQAMDLLGNVTVLERPTRVAALVSAVRTALRARQRQYQIRKHLLEHKRAEQALRDADQRKNEFLAILAHELRNPLAPIRNSLDILRSTTPPDSTAERFTELMDRQVTHMVRLVDDLLEVARVSRGKIELRKEPVDLAAIVRSAVEMSQPLIDAAGHDLSLAVPPEPLMLEGDFVRLTQVVANLLNNAAKYSDAAGKIWLDVHREGNGAVISVRDTGAGIPPDVLPRVFELFMQVNRQPGRSHGGLGIGLTLVKNLVEMHGGSVEAHSEGAGRGSEFVVHLPLVASNLAAHAPGEAAGSRAYVSSRRVLVVDDNRDAGESLGALLKLLGADAHVVYSGPAGLEALSIHKPEIVLLDIGMPGMDGYEVARRIRQRPEFQQVTLIALTGWGQEEDRQRSRSAGFDYHLIKPADIKVLQNLLISAGLPRGLD